MKNKQLDTTMKAMLIAMTMNIIILMMMRTLFSFTMMMMKTQDLER